MFTDILTLLKKVNRQIWELSNKCIDILFFEIKIYEIVFEETMYYKQQFIVSNSVTQAMLPKLEILFCDIEMIFGAPLVMKLHVMYIVKKKISKGFEQ